MSFSYRRKLKRARAQHGLRHGPRGAEETTVAGFGSHHRKCGRRGQGAAREDRARPARHRARPARHRARPARHRARPARHRARPARTGRGGTGRGPRGTGRGPRGTGRGGTGRGPSAASISSQHPRMADAEPARAELGESTSGEQRRGHNGNYRAMVSWRGSGGCPRVPAAAQGALGPRALLVSHRRAH
ncbi:hypothetical protein NDU88_012029 [Pleurodeles waltl]|uniref:Uncharacterized protein n=1 Tax=Pleurodeles waltl TaxID=8319 RepID=A0AAV7S5D1_PLEWA|nr:hypothetical protein NDU88_012029 [Pleurodeles waltl]